MAEKNANPTGPTFSEEEMLDIAAQRVAAGGDELTDLAERLSAQLPLEPLDSGNPEHIDKPLAPEADPADLIDDPGLQTQPDPFLMAGPTGYEKMLRDVEERLRGSGEFDEETINNVLRPAQYITNRNISNETLERMYELAEPVFGENHEALAAARELFGELEGQGLERDASIDWSVLRQFASHYSEEAMVGLSGMARWRRRAARKAGEAVALVKPMALKDWNAGMALLDTVARGLNSFRIGTMDIAGRLTEEEKWQLQSEFLPPVTVQNPRTGELDFYATQLGANWDLGWDYTASWWRMVHHQGMSWFRPGARGRG